MAAPAGTYATGAQHQAGALRQRGAPELVVNGQSVELDAEDKKKLQVRQTCRQCSARSSNKLYTEEAEPKPRPAASR